MRRRTPALVGLGLAAATWEAARRGDARAIEADPLAARLADLPEGREVPVVSADGTALHAEVHGDDDAPAVVLVHGWTCASAFWALQVKDLVAAGLRVIAFDLRGHGRSAQPEARDYAMERFAEDLVAVLDATLAHDERAVVAGHSLGAMTIAAVGLEQPEAVRRMAAVALLNTGVGDLLSESLVVKAPPTVTEVAGRVLLEATAPIPRRSTPISFRIVRHIALCPDAPPAAVAFTEQLVGRCRADVRGSVGGTLSRLELAEGLAHLDVPTLVLAGADDRLTPPVHAERMAEALPDVTELCVLERTGHMAPLERDGEVTSRLLALAREHLGAPAAAAV